MPTHGAEFLGFNETRFNLWAPDARRVSVEFSGGARHTMHCEEGSWFSRRLLCAPGTCYRFVIDDHVPVPDPASHFQPQGMHGYSQVIDHRAYPWLHADWQGRPWHESVIYEMHMGLAGGFLAATRHFARLRQMGITALQLIPVAGIAHTPHHSRDGLQLFAPHADYGTPDDLKRMVDIAHDHGLMVLMDVMYHQLTVGNRRSHSFSEAFFKRSSHALNFQRPEVRDFFYQNAAMWIHHYGMDGLRLDATQAMSNPDFFPGLARHIRTGISADRQVHLIAANNKNCKTLPKNTFDARYNDDAHNILNSMLTGETHRHGHTHSASTAQHLVQALTQGCIDDNSTPGPTDQTSERLSPTAFVLFLQNHQQIGFRPFGERLISLCTQSSLKAATALMLLCPMIPMLIMGEETGSTRPLLNFPDHPQVRSGMQPYLTAQTSTLSYAGPDSDDAQSLCAWSPFDELEQTENSRNWEVFYSNLMHLRRLHIIPRLHNSRILRTTVLGEAAMLAEWLMGDGSILLIALNLGRTAVRAPELVNNHALIYAQGVDSDTGHMEPDSVSVRLAAPGYC